MNRISFRLGGAALLVCSAFTLVALAADRGFFNPPSTDQKASDVNQQFTSTLNAHRRNTPDETRYDCAEPDTLNAPPCSSLNSERYDLFGFPSSLTALTARYSDPSDPLRFGKPQVSGLNVSGAWKVQRGRPDVTVAVLDTGVRWDKVGLRTQIRLNCKELPAPRNGSGQNLSGSSPGCMESNYRYDINNSGDLDVDDYINDVRVNKNAGPNGVPNAVDGQDLIKAFSNGDDADGNGYVDDIAGWDFFDDDNDPYDASSYFAAANHGTGRAEEAVESGNDGVGNIGICPKCTFMPMRIWDTFVSDANTFGLAVTYAADNGVDVIVGANGSLYHSEFMEAASAYAWSKGLIQTYSGDDLNTGNHNYPAAYNHAMLIEGTVPDTVGLNADNAQTQQARALFCTGPLAGQCPPSNVPVSTYFRSANTAQFGGKSSISMWGSTGSQNTGRAGGAAAIVVSAGLDFFGNGNRLSADEVRIILEQTAEDVTAPNTLGVGNPDPAQPGWDSHFGWGRVDLGKAVQAVREGNIPPEAAIITPDWYAPLVGNSVSLTGIARARHASGGNFHYRVEWGAGQAPTGLPGNPWNLIVEGDASGTLTDLGTVNLAAVRAALATFVVPPDAADATFSPSSPHPLQDQFTVRLTVTVPGKMPGIDRKVLTALPDGQSLVAGYPKRLGSGGEAPIRYADLNGDNIQELIVPAQDGLIHAYQPDGSELKGWPVATATFQSAVKHLDAPVFNSGGVAPPREPPRGPTIADFDGDGKRQLVTAAGLHVLSLIHI